VKKLRAQIDANGYKDVEMKLIGDVPWSRGTKDRNNDISVGRRNGAKHLAAAGLVAEQGADPSSAARNSNGMGSDFEEQVGGGGYWPSYLWADGEVGEKVGSIAIPMGSGGGGGGGGGGRAHAANEYYTIEGTGKGQSYVTGSKASIAGIFEYAKVTTTPPKPKTRLAK
jgi:hypothetical protein